MRPLSRRVRRAKNLFSSPKDFAKRRPAFASKPMILMHLIEIEGLAKNFGPVAAVRGISFTVDRGAGFSRRQLKQETIADTIGRVLQGLALEDVDAAESVPAGTPAGAAHFVTLDGLTGDADGRRHRQDSQGCHPAHRRLDLQTAGGRGCHPADQYDDVVEQPKPEPPKPAGSRGR